MTSAGHRESPSPLKLCAGEHQALAGNFQLLLTWDLHSSCGRQHGGGEVPQALFILMMMIIPNELVRNHLPPQTQHNTTKEKRIFSPWMREKGLRLHLNHFPGENREAHLLHRTTEDGRWEKEMAWSLVRMNTSALLSNLQHSLLKQNSILLLPEFSTQAQSSCRTQRQLLPSLRSPAWEHQNLL